MTPFMICIPWSQSDSTNKVRSASVSCNATITVASPSPRPSFAAVAGAFLRDSAQIPALRRT